MHRLSLPRIQKEARFLVSTCAIAGLAVLLPATPQAARNRTQPTVTVLPFTGIGEAEEQEAMADELAMRLVETGRFRVLLREWLPVLRVEGAPTLDSVRQAATDAGVQYLMLGSVTESLALRRPSPLALLAPIVASRMRGARPVLGRPAPHRETVIAVNVRVLDVTSGDVVRSALGRASSSTRPPAPVVAGPGLIGSVATIARLARRHDSKSPLNAGTERAIADVAKTLNLENSELRSQKPEMSTQNLEARSQK